MHLSYTSSSMNFHTYLCIKTQCQDFAGGPVVENPFQMLGTWGRSLMGKLRSLMPWGNEDLVQRKQNPKPQCRLQKLKKMCTCLEGGGNWIPGDFLGVWIMFYFLNQSLPYSNTSSLPVRTMPNELHIQAYPRPESFRVSHPETNTGRESQPPQGLRPPVGMWRAGEVSQRQPGATFWPL